VAISAAVALVVAALVVAALVATRLDAAQVALLAERDAAPGASAAVVSDKVRQDAAQAVGVVVASALKISAAIASRLPIAANSTASSACHPTRDCTTSVPEALVLGTLALAVTPASGAAGQGLAPAAWVDRRAVLGCDLVLAPGGRALVPAVSVDQRAVLECDPALAPGGRAWVSAVWAD
jgi:hypothetical protein